MLKQQIAIYTRLSLEDIDKRSNKVKDESNSISSQRIYINRHLDKIRELSNIPRIEFSDDGFSGTTFDRPDFVRMIELIKRGEISCVIVKDLSRFGRDYLEVGDYLEHLFPFLGVRFISINDHYDSLRHNGTTIGTDIAFKNLIYDYYCKDLSTKVKSAMAVRQKECKFVNCVPYGYKASPQDKHQLIVDPPASNIVQRIFLSIIAGKTPTEIARELNSEGVPTPSEYKDIQKHRKKSDKQYQWTHRAIHTIIGNIKYTGTMVNHTRESRYIRDRNQRKVPQEEWHIRENAHDSIVTKEEYEQAHSAIKKRRGYVRSSHDISDRVYYCGHCGRKLEKANGTVFACPSHRYHENSKCSNVYVRKDDIEDVVEKAFLTRTKSSTPNCEQVAGCNSQNKSVISLEVTRLNKQLEAAKERKLALYERYKAKAISLDSYMREKEAIASEEEMAKLCIANATKKLEQLNNAEADIIQTEDGKSTITLAYEAIKQVVVKSPSDIEIVWKDAKRLTAQ